MTDLRLHRSPCDARPRGPPRQSTPPRLRRPYRRAGSGAAARSGTGAASPATARAAQLDQREQALRQREREIAEQRRVLAEEYRLLRASTTRRPAGTAGARIVTARIRGPGQRRAG